jgi:hypothetical protein
LEQHSTCLGGLSVHHQESKTVRTVSGACHTGSVSAGKRERDRTAYHLVPASKQLHNLHDIYLMLYVQSWTPDDGWRDSPKHVECCSKIK